jgi:hypothetical protein
MPVSIYLVGVTCLAGERTHEHVSRRAAAALLLLPMPLPLLLPLLLLLLLLTPGV